MMGKKMVGWARRRARVTGRKERGARSHNDWRVRWGMVLTARRMRRDRVRRLKPKMASKARGWGRWEAGR